MTDPPHKPSSSGSEQGSPSARRPAVSLTYEERLAKDVRWALSEGSRHFQEDSALHEALRRIVARLNELGIPYAVAGGMALFRHGFRRFTEDVDILVTRGDLRTIHEKLVGLGYVPIFAGSKGLRDAELGVRIEFLVSGDYPGDGKPKPVAFPAPSERVVERGGVSYLSLEALVELKLASGMTGPDRMKDLADVQELIKLLNLPRDFARRLDPYVRGKYEELWVAGRRAPRRYVRIWRPAGGVGDVRTFDDLIAALPDAAEMLEAMRADGVRLEVRGAGDSVRLVTDDPEVARKYDMHDEAEFLDSGSGPGGDGES
jgi:hypothetical protein